MSPLSSFLVALSALFAVANALVNRNCDYLDLGDQSHDFVTFDITSPVGKVEIPDKCTRPGNQLIGELIQVCSPLGKPHLTPLIGPKVPLQAVYVECPDVPECHELTLEVVQYCKMFYTPMPPGA